MTFESYCLGLANRTSPLPNRICKACLNAAAAPPLSTTIKSLSRRLRMCALTPGPTPVEVNIELICISKGFARQQGAENSHQPLRRRERKMQGFKSARRSVFVSIHAAVYNTFNVQRHLLSWRIHRQFRTAAHKFWSDATVATACTAWRPRGRLSAPGMDILGRANELRTATHSSWIDSIVAVA
jgi:hypothetical protein